MRKIGSTLVLRAGRGEELLKSIQSACDRKNVKFGFITGLGAADHAAAAK